MTTTPTATPSGAAKRWSADRAQRMAFPILRRIVIAGLLLSIVLPFYYMFLLSIRPIERLLADPSALLPDDLTFKTYSEVLMPVDSGGQGFSSFLVNSLVVAAATVLLALVIAIPGAYAISRLRFFGRRQVSALFLATYLFPAIVLAIPLFAVFTRLQLRGTLFGLILVYIAQTVPVAIYMLRNYFETVPQAIEEAAMVDGLGRMGVLVRISIPLAMPSIIATGLFIFMIAWNEFLFALLFLVDHRESWTVSLGLSQLSGSVEIPTTVLMAGSVIITVPVIALFFFTERLLSGGLVAGAEKG
jgi:multiple sugar transport system permease protein